MKGCTKCLEQKLESEFPKWKSGRVGSWCKECVKLNSRKWYAENKEKADLKRKKYYQDHKEETIAKWKIHYEKNREEIRKRANEQNRNCSPERRSKQNAYAREWTRKNRDKVSAKSHQYFKKSPEKFYARQAVVWALRFNLLQRPEKCSMCKCIGKIEAHHEDYSKPLEVQWICRPCHVKEHMKLKD